MHFLQIWITPGERGITPSYEQKTFSATKSRDGLRVVASPDGRDGSVTLHPDATLYAGLSSKVTIGGACSRSGRHAWVHVVRGTGARERPGYHRYAGALPLALSDEVHRAKSRASPAAKCSPVQTLGLIEHRPTRGLHRETRGSGRVPVATTPTSPPADRACSRRRFRRVGAGSSAWRAAATMLEAPPKSVTRRGLGRLRRRSRSCVEGRASSPRLLARRQLFASADRGAHEVAVQLGDELDADALRAASSHSRWLVQ